MNIHIKIGIVIGYLAVTATFNASAGNLLPYVNPMVGTKSMGHTFPGACAPFGLVQLSPATEMVPHNIISTTIKRLSGSVIPISTARGIPIWVIF